MSGVTYYILNTSLLGIVWRMRLSPTPGLMKDIARGCYFSIGQYALLIIYPVNFCARS